MSQTKNLGLPLWGQTPPKGATGLDLRNAILGENINSLVQILDRKIGVIEDEDIFTEQTISEFTYTDNMYKKDILTPFALTAGEHYLVMWNGATYSCVAYTSDGDIIIGNESYVNVDALESVEPFAIIYNQTENHNTLISSEEPRSLSIVRNISIEEIELVLRSRISALEEQITDLSNDDEWGEF